MATTLNKKDYSILESYSHGEISWRAAVRDLRLWDLNELKNLLKQHELPLPTANFYDTIAVESLFQNLTEEA